MVLLFFHFQKLVVSLSFCLSHPTLPDITPANGMHFKGLKSGRTHYHGIKPTMTTIPMGGITLPLPVLERQRTRPIFSSLSAIHMDRQRKVSTFSSAAADHAAASLGVCLKYFGPDRRYMVSLFDHPQTPKCMQCISESYTTTLTGSTW